MKVDHIYYKSKHLYVYQETKTRIVLIFDNGKQEIVYHLENNVLTLDCEFDLLILTD
jgi:hypothetical protein